MSWLFIVTIAHFLNAGAFLVDKFLLMKAVPKPHVYAFWIGVLGLFALVLLPFGATVPSISNVTIAFAAGGTFELALLFFFEALHVLETSRVVPFIGGLQPLIILLFSYLFLGERLTTNESIAFILLLLGTIVISYRAGGSAARETIRQRHGWGAALLATFLFAVSYTLTKAVFTTQPFIGGFVLIRLGAFLTVLFFLFYRPWRRDILEQQDMPGGALRTLFLIGQSAGAVSALLMNYVISLASVTLVTAMQGMQYGFLFLMAILLGSRYRQLREEMTTAIVARKIIAIVMITGGLVLLAA